MTGPSLPKAPRSQSSRPAVSAQSVRLSGLTIAAVAEGVCGSEALALRLALQIDMLAAQQNRRDVR